MPNLNKEEVISNIYYDLSDGYGSIKKTLEDAKKIDPSITYEDVKRFLTKQPNKQIKGYSKFNSFVAPFPRYEYQIDIMDMVDLQKDETQPRYAIVVIDIFSKYGYVEAMVNKNSISVLKGLKTAFDKMGYPNNIYSDDDGAFMSNVKDFLDKEGINKITTKTHANVVERFIRTLKSKIHDRVRFTKGKWEDMIPYVLKQYNNTEHSTTEYKPIQAHKDDNIPNV